MNTTNVTYLRPATHRSPRRSPWRPQSAGPRPVGQRRSSAAPAPSGPSMRRLRSVEPLPQQGPGSARARRHRLPVPGAVAGSAVGLRRRVIGAWWRGQSGQATAEYALVMLAAAGLAGMVLAWAVSGNGVERLMNAVMDSIIAEVTG